MRQVRFCPFLLSSHLPFSSLFCRTNWETLGRDVRKQLETERAQEGYRGAQTPAFSFSLSGRGSALRSAASAAVPLPFFSYLAAQPSVSEQLSRQREWALLQACGFRYPRPNPDPIRLRQQQHQQQQGQGQGSEAGAGQGQGGQLTAQMAAVQVLQDYERVLSFQVAGPAAGSDHGLASAGASGQQQQHGYGHGNTDSDSTRTPAAPHSRDRMGSASLSSTTGPATFSAGPDRHQDPSGSLFFSPLAPVRSASLFDSPSPSPSASASHFLSPAAGLYPVREEERGREGRAGIERDGGTGSDFSSFVHLLSVSTADLSSSSSSS